MMSTIQYEKTLIFIADIVEQSGSAYLYAVYVLCILLVFQFLLFRNAGR